MKTIDFTNQAELDQVGNYVGQCEVVTQFFETYPMIHYVSGIPEFDKFLDGKKFAETNLNHVIIIYEKAIIFQLYREKNGELNAGIWKQDFKEIIPHYKQTIEVWSVNTISKSLKTGGFGLINALAGAAADKIIDATKNKKYKEVKGAIFEICVKNSDDTVDKITISCESSSLYKVHEFFNKYFGCNFQ